jgi:hypothetical protein
MQAGKPSGSGETRKSSGPVLFSDNLGPSTTLTRFARMKALATAMLAIGLVAFLASSALFAYRFATLGGATSAALGMVSSGALACFAVFMRSRAIAGIRTFEVTENDRVEFRQLRQEITIGWLLARLLGTFASLFFVGGVMSVVYPDSSGRTGWHTAVVMILLSQILLLCVWLLTRKRNDPAQPPNQGNSKGQPIH